MTTRISFARTVRIAAFWVLLPFALAVLLDAVKWSYHPDPDAWMYDMRSYIAGGRAILDGQDPYTVQSEFGEYFVYPPFALLLFLPIARLSWNAIALIWGGISVLALQASIWLALKGVGVKRLEFWSILVLIPSLILYPVDQTIHQGQINLLLLVLVLMDVSLPATSRAKDVLIGLCAGIKIIPIVFCRVLHPRSEIPRGASGSCHYGVHSFCGVDFVSGALS